MTLESLTEKHNDLVRYLAERDRHHATEIEAMQADIDALLARVAQLDAVTV
jgi:hypothetical protein